jgi:hypothetical protein
VEESGKPSVTTLAPAWIAERPMNHESSSGAPSGVWRGEGEVVLRGATGRASRRDLALIARRVVAAPMNESARRLGGARNVCAA